MTNTRRTSILITGATSGIGRATALHLAQKGFHVIATGRSEATLTDLVREGQGALDTLVLDVTSGVSIAAAAAEVDRITQGQGVDVLINNAGFATAVAALDMTDEDLRTMFDTNVFGLMAVTRAFVGGMIARGAGRVINLSSVGGRMTTPLLGGYNGTKYAVESLSDALRVELAPFGVRVLLVEPGGVRTNFAGTSMKALASYSTPNSPWTDLYSRAGEILAQAETMSTTPDVIARAIERAITARRPAARYVVPFSARIMLLVIENLPTPWADWILSRAFGTHRLRLPRKGAARRA